MKCFSQPEGTLYKYVFTNLQTYFCETYDTKNRPVHTNNKLTAPDPAKKKTYTLRWRAITWTNAEALSNENSSVKLNQKTNIVFKKMCFKLLCAICRPFCSDVSVVFVSFICTVYPVVFSRCHRRPVEVALCAPRCLKSGGPLIALSLKWKPVLNGWESSSAKKSLAYHRAVRCNEVLVP